MHPNEALIEKFYQSFQKLDSTGMGECYHTEIAFSDPAFPDLKGEKAGAMWQMLCERAADLELTFSDIQADDTTGKAHWEATYTFSKTGRKVHNKIDAQFKFKDGKIIEHKDYFDFWKWSKMALGPMGAFLGWSSFLRNKVQSQSNYMLEKFISKKKSSS